ncbi:MAG: ferrous iron transport protein B [Candidatus Aminicenantales bacterium]
MEKSNAPYVIFLGQPNCGKSTLFNAIAGHKAQTSNFPGTSVHHTHSKVNIEGRILNIIDLPGTYSLNPSDPAERVALTHLFKEKPDVLINVVDASILGRSLELTLELLEIEIPMVVALNMMDLAEKKGVVINPHKLEKLLGIPVIPTIASRGRGVKEMLEAAIQCLKEKSHGAHPEWTRDVEEEIEKLISEIPADFTGMANRRFTAIQMIESGNLFCSEFIKEIHPALNQKIEQSRQALERKRRMPAYEVIAAERHHIAYKIFEASSRVQRRMKASWTERVDDLLMHPILGYPILLLILLTFFFAIYKVGSPLEEVLLGPLSSLRGFLSSHLGQGLWFHLSDGVLQGIGGGVAIVLPYFIPLLFLMALLEDVGYLARAGFLLDTFMHRIGLHGKSVSPFILGFGCNVPAIISTRILESRRDRIITSLLIPFIPCSARTTIILALVAFYLGPIWALGFYVFNILLIGAIGRLITLVARDSSPGLILEIPSLKIPSLKNIFFKIYFQLKSFIQFAWPLLILGSIILGIIQFAKADQMINAVLSPLVVKLLGLPQELGVTLIFGFLRKELSLLMMLQALGVSYPDILSVISRNQLIVFTVFISFFIPCLSTFAVLWKETGKKIAFLSAGLSISVAVLVSFLIRWLV